MEKGTRQSSISKCVRGEIQSAGGWFWRKKGSLKEPVPPTQREFRGSPVEQVCKKTGAVLATFPSQNAAAETTWAPQSSISKCLRGEIKTAGGYLWRYKSEKGPAGSDPDGKDGAMV